MPEFDKIQLEFLLNKYTSEYLEKEFTKQYVLVEEIEGKILGLGSLIIEDSEIRVLFFEI